VGGLAGWAYFGIKGISEANDIAAMPCAATKTCDPGRVSAVKRQLIAADVSMVVGLLSAGAAAYIYFSDRRAHAAAAHASISVAPGVGSVTFTAPF
jgi:hypothetical protein